MSLPFGLEPPGYWSADLPVSGAWMETDAPGERLFHDLTPDRPFVLECGESLTTAHIAYETWGELNENADNAVLLCHALTGDSHATGGVCAHHPDGGWWDDFVGPGKPVDTDRWFVVCANALGGCQGSTGPASIMDPESGQRWGMRFPTVTTRDIVRTQASLADALGIRRWHSVIGGSMGGMQVLEWALMFPERVHSIMPIATTVSATPWQIGWSAAGRLSISLDPGWNGGDYYDAAPGQGPHAGLAIARAIAQITYRSDEVYQERFDRNLVDPSHVFGRWDRFQVESYLHHHGEKLVRRFDANSYIVLNRAMDLHDCARGRSSMEKAFARLAAPVLTISISSDVLYQPRLQTDLADLARGAGVHVEHQYIESPHGHDGFLLESDAVGAAMAKFLDTVDDLH